MKTTTSKITVMSCALLLSAALSTAANAADANWQGLYGGIIAGYGDGEITGLGSLVDVDATDDMSGMTYGLLAGWNTQSGNWVYGFEGDVSLTSIDGDIVVLGEPSVVPAKTGPSVASANVGVNVTEEIDWSADLRARIGYLAGPNTLIYGAAGLAIADYEIVTDSEDGGMVETKSGPLYAGANNGSTLSDSATFTGWTIGGGVETRLADNVKGRLEYLYSDYGTQNMFSSVGGVDVGGTQNTFRIGIVMNFGG